MQDLNLDINPEENEAFERRLDQALAAAPQPAIPQEFAARIAALVPAPKPLPERTFAYARNSIIFSAVVVLIALLLLAPHATVESTHAMALEWILSAELSLLALSFVLPGSLWTSIR